MPRNPKKGGAGSGGKGKPSGGGSSKPGSSKKVGNAVCSLEGAASRQNRAKTLSLPLCWPVLLCRLPPSSCRQKQLQYLQWVIGCTLLTMHAGLYLTACPLL